MSRKRKVLSLETARRRIRFTISGKAGDLSLLELEAMLAYGLGVAKRMMRESGRGGMTPDGHLILWDMVRERLEESMGMKL
jgi:hypothetical protein